MVVWKSVCSKKYHSENCPSGQCLLGELPVRLTVLWRTVPVEPSVREMPSGNCPLGKSPLGKCSSGKYPSVNCPRTSISTFEIDYLPHAKHKVQ